MKQQHKVRTLYQRKSMNRRTRTNIADCALVAALLVTVPIAWASVAAFFLLIDWVAG